MAVDRLLAEAHRFLDWSRDQGAGLDGTDESVWFVQGTCQSMAEDTEEPPPLRATKCLAFAVYLAELLASSCQDVRREIDGDGLGLREVLAVRDGAATQFTLSWVRKCIADPVADNLFFKFAGALRDFGEDERATAMDQYCEIYGQWRSGESG